MEFYILLIFTLIVISVAVILWISNRKINIKLMLAYSALTKRQSQAHQMGVNQASGDLHQVIGEFQLLDVFDELITLSTTSKQGSLDMIGVMWEEMKLVFLEIKKKGARMTPKENRLRKIVESKNVEYRIIDVSIPTGIKVEERSLPISSSPKTVRSRS